MCEILSVSRSGYYNWNQALPSARAFENNKIAALIKLIFKQNREAYGTRRIKKALAKEDLVVSRRRIGRINSNRQRWHRASEN